MLNVNSRLSQNYPSAAGHYPLLTNSYQNNIFMNDSEAGGGDSVMDTRSQGARAAGQVFPYISSTANVMDMRSNSLAAAGNVPDALDRFLSQ